MTSSVRSKNKPKRPRETDAVDSSIETSDKDEQDASGHPVVGIGASAGGLAAFEAFFSGMPVDSDPGMAFVLVQHLDPDHKSILTDLIRRYTRMRVFEVEDGMQVEPNCAYIIPPNRDMAFLKGTLQLMKPTAPRGQRLPIDFFFRSLAQDQRERAVCIVLSGTGSDGTQGVKSVKGEGGMVMVQNPSCAEYDGMPRNAIATGLVDYVLSPEEMPAYLIAYVAHAFGKVQPFRIEKTIINENELKKIFVLLRSHTDHDFSQYKPSTIQRRVERRMAVQQIETVAGYVKYIQQTPEEVEALFRDILIGVTNFFRDPDAFEALEKTVIPKLFAERPAGATIRIWSAGCSTGEEAYSLAILLQERSEALKQSYKIQVFATDIDSGAIAAARTGLYPASIASDMSPERFARFFAIETDGSAYRIHKGIRDMLVFSEQDLIRDPPFSKLDLISCRNLLIYMGTTLQKKLVPLFHYALNPGGFLYLGNSETVGEFGDLFTTLDRKLKLYQRREDLHGPGRATVGHFHLPAKTTSAAPPRASGQMADYGKRTPREMTEQALLQQLDVAAALVNGQGDILYIHGRTGMYLEPSPGDAGINNIFKMAREGLERDLTTALHKTVANQKIVRCPGVRVKSNGDFVTVNLTVSPVALGAAAIKETPLYLVVLDRAPSLKDEQAKKSADLGSNAAADSSDASTEFVTRPNAEERIAVLMQKLKAKEEYLQAANEELETSNEELRSSNEEMQSVNEELQSTNEELETSKEELQSVNEELATVNAELQTKVSDLSRVNNDMNNLLAGTDIGTVFVDHQLRILRFTPAVTAIINLIPSDVGRPVSHIVSNLVNYDRMMLDMQAVLANLIPKEVEVQTRADAWYTMRILPYRTLDNVIEGAVITFVNITETKKTRDKLQESETKYRGLFENTDSAMALHEMVMDQQVQPVDYVFLEANPAYERFTGLNAADILGKRITQMSPGVEKSHLISAYGKVAQTGESHSFELFFEPRQRRCRITAFQVGPNRFASVFVDAEDRGPQDQNKRRAE